MQHGRPIAYQLFDANLANSRTYFVRYRIIYIEIFLFIFSSVFLLYLLLISSDFPPLIAVLTSVVFILITPYFMEYYYDYPELTFMMLSVWVALKYDWWWIIPVGALAAWNKESFLLFIPTLYPFMRRQSDSALVYVRLFILGVTCILVHSLIWMHFRRNFGGTVEWHILDQINFFQHPINLIISRDVTYGVTHPAPFTLIPLILIASIVLNGWARLPVTFQLHAKIATVINLPLYIIFCWPGELRNLSMLYVSFATLIATIIWQPSPEAPFTSAT
jgi:hypothetical protein